MADGCKRMKEKKGTTFLVPFEPQNGCKGPFVRRTSHFSARVKGAKVLGANCKK